MNIFSRANRRKSANKLAVVAVLSFFAVFAVWVPEAPNTFWEFSVGAAFAVSTFLLIALRLLGFARYISGNKD